MNEQNRRSIATLRVEVTIGKQAGIHGNPHGYRFALLPGTSRRAGKQAGSDRHEVRIPQPQRGQEILFQPGCGA